MGKLKRCREEQWRCKRGMVGTVQGAGKDESARGTDSKAVWC